MEYIPDPRTIIEDAQDKEKEDRDAEDRRKVRRYGMLYNNIHIESRRRKNGEGGAEVGETGGEEEEEGVVR